MSGFVTKTYRLVFGVEKYNDYILIIDILEERQSLILPKRPDQRDWKLVLICSTN